MELIDLHCHSTVSDGSFSPTELAHKARDIGLRAFALTDHDNIGGVEEAMKACGETGVEFIPGVEISAAFSRGTMHIVGYFLWEGRNSLSQKLEKLQEARAERNPLMVEKLRGLGLDISMDDVAGQAGGDQIGRPHMAKALIEKGYVANINEAFNKYLAKGKPAYEEKFRFPPPEAISMILDAGGVPGLAHPFTLDLNDTELDELVAELRNEGLEGLEVYSPEHNPDQIRLYQKLAAKYGLVVTGGTDFHGANKPDVEMGIGRGNFRVPYSLLGALKKRRDELRSA